MPWLALARDARNRGDLAGEAAAFARAADARRSDFYDDAMLQAALADMPRDAKPLERAALAYELIGYQSAMPRLELSEATRYCSREALQQDEGRRQCNAVAEVLVSEDKSLLDLGIGISLGERLGWEPERTAQLRQTFESMVHLVYQSPTDFWSCQSVTRALEVIDGRAQSGEVPFLKLRVQSGAAVPVADAR